MTGGVMNNPILDWLVLLTTFILLWCTVCNFSRRTFRIVVLAAITTAVVFITRFGLTKDHPGNYGSAFQHGGSSLAWVMFTPVLHGSVSQINSLDGAGWIVPLILVGVALAWFDTW